jgi:hypothetical protein
MLEKFTEAARDVRGAIEQFEAAETCLNGVLARHADFFTCSTSQYMWIHWAHSHTWQARRALESILNQRDFTFPPI